MRGPAITELRVTPRRRGRLDDSWIVTAFDGRETVRAPLAHFFGAGPHNVWVDDDALPSWFGTGTGTEDSFGYAFSLTEQVAALRIHALDAIPFAEYLRFDLELFHWAERATLGYDTVWYFYVRR